jgi:hypothetical protein
MLSRFICRQLLVCAAKTLRIALDQIDLSKLELTQIRPLANGGVLLVLDPKKN